MSDDALGHIFFAVGEAGHAFATDEAHAIDIEQRRCPVTQSGRRATALMEGCERGVKIFGIFKLEHGSLTAAHHHRIEIGGIAFVQRGRRFEQRHDIRPILDLIEAKRIGGGIAAFVAGIGQRIEGGRSAIRAGDGERLPGILEHLERMEQLTRPQPHELAYGDAGLRIGDDDRDRKTHDQSPRGR